MGILSYRVRLKYIISLSIILNVKNIHVIYSMKDKVDTQEQNKNSNIKLHPSILITTQNKIIKSDSLRHEQD